MQKSAVLFPLSRRAGQAGGTAPRPATRWSIIGIALVIVYAAQAFGEWHWHWLAGLQDIELYKQVTGAGLVLLFAVQWRLTAARTCGATRRANQLLVPHRYWGAVVPLCLYLHADNFGYAYIRVMSLGVLSLVLVGCLHPSVIRFNRNWLTTAWLVTHIALAATLMVVIGYHAFNAFFYE